MKKLYLLRHADAVTGTGQKDSERELTELGRKQAAEAAVQAREKHLDFDVILTSPLLRALETAQIFAAVYQTPEKVIEEPLLASGCTVQKLRKVLERYADSGSVLCVGHEPDLGVIAAALLGRDHAHPLKKAECLEIDMQNVPIEDGV